MKDVPSTWKSKARRSASPSRTSGLPMTSCIQWKLIKSLWSSRSCCRIMLCLAAKVCDLIQWSDILIKFDSPIKWYYQVFRSADLIWLSESIIRFFRWNRAKGQSRHPSGESQVCSWWYQWRHEDSQNWYFAEGGLPQPCLNSDKINLLIYSWFLIILFMCIDHFALYSNLHLYRKAIYSIINNWKLTRNERSIIILKSRMF